MKNQHIFNPLLYDKSLLNMENHMTLFLKRKYVWQVLFDIPFSNVLVFRMIGGTLKFWVNNLKQYIKADVTIIQKKKKIFTKLRIYFKSLIPLKQFCCDIEIFGYP